MSIDQKELIHSSDFDTLIILDACRYDVFSQIYEPYFSGVLLKVRSRASCTRDWLRETWTEDYKDITYISCNQFMASQDYKHPSQYEPRHKFKRIIDVWKEGLMPENIEKYALTTPGRKVLHYNFPHKPYYGKIRTLDLEGYWSNLEFVLEHIEKLLPKLSGLTVITSDHGELFSRHGVIHPCSGPYDNDPRLRDVPWFIPRLMAKG